MHVRLCQNLKALFLDNIQNIHNVVSTEGYTLFCGFLGMRWKSPEDVEVTLIQSIHNTGKPYTNVALIPSENYEEALVQFSAIHPGILSKVAPEFHDKVFIQGQYATMTSGYHDSVNSWMMSNYARELLNLYNLQDGEDIPDPPMNKWFRQATLSYSSAVQSSLSDLPAIANVPQTAQIQTTVSSMTESDIDQLYECLKHHIPDQPITAEDMRY